MGIVAVVGHGKLAERVRLDLAARHEVVPLPDCRAGIPDRVGMFIALQDEWEPSWAREAEKTARERSVPWLNAFIWYEEAVVGPIVRPGAVGCSQCAETRRFMAGGHRGMSELQVQWLLADGPIDHPYLDGFALRHVSRLIVSEAESMLSDSPALTVGHVFLIDLRTLEHARHPVLPDPLCPVCGRLPGDSAESACIALQPAPKARPGTFRVRSLDRLGETFLRDYLDERTGLANRTVRQSRTAFADVTVHVPLPGGEEVAAGRSHSYRASLLTGILEGLERYCGSLPRGKRTTVVDSYRKLAPHALHPLEVGLYAPEQYANPDFPYAPFDPDRPMHWVWGHSFLQDRPLLVPECLAYYNSEHDRDLVGETSNGCALGASVEEAILHGLLEVVERDAFLMAWYARLPVPRVDPQSAGDPVLSLMIERARAVAGYDIEIYNTTTETGVPSVWTVARNRGNEGIRLLCGAGAHPVPAEAAKHAIHELTGILPMLNADFAERREELRLLLDDAALVEEMEDHALLYGLPEAEERLSFLSSGRRPQSFPESFPPFPAHADLRDDLKELLHRFARLGLDVVVVDQTAPELSRHGLHTVKVIVPGMLPMTFGHSARRIHGLTRALRAPELLGYASKPLTAAQLNPLPHPFP